MLENIALSKEKIEAKLKHRYLRVTALVFKDNAT